MPKKPTKTREEKAVESHFVIKKEDIKKTTEKAVKRQTPQEDILKKVTEKPVRKTIAQKVQKLFTTVKRKEKYAFSVD